MADESRSFDSLPGWGDFTRFMDAFKLPNIDVAALVEWQRKDMEALAEANRKAYEGVSSLIDRRSQILQETFAQWQAAMKDAGAAGMMSMQSEAVKESMEQAIANFRELADMEAKTRSDVWKVVQDRVEENLANLQKLLQPK